MKYKEALKTKKTIPFNLEFNGIIYYTTIVPFEEDDFFDFLKHLLEQNNLSDKKVVNYSKNNKYKIAFLHLSKPMILRFNYQ
ncbi:hypothetical protein TPENAI_60859 [Tenacibaculum litopenaei]|uniref:hypothetical protein n=1 Tax=Tenacibaculum litopenaei TaxID=396016 RepID=UPI0038936626